MLLEFIAAIVLGVAVAGVVMAINVATGRRLPGWLVPGASWASKRTRWSRS